MNYINEVTTNDINMNPFKVKNKLHPDFFKDDNSMNSQIRMRLLDIADDFIETLEVKWVKPLDIIVTGSIANYNWSEYSDVDVHVVYDFSKIYKKTEFVKDYFMSKRDVWNNSHDNLTIKGFPVELSVEDVNSPLQSSGVYSIEKNKWIKEPKDMDDSNIDIKGIKKYCAKQMTKMDDLFAKMDKEKDRTKLEKLANELESILDAVHDKRKQGLETKEKELSNGNIMWKVVKHMGYADKVYDYLNKVYDRRNTIDERKVIYLSEKQVSLLETVYKNNIAYNYLGAYLPKFTSIVGKKLTKKDLPRIHDIFDKWYKLMLPPDSLTGNLYIDDIAIQVISKPGFQNELKNLYGVKSNHSIEIPTEVKKVNNREVLDDIYYNPAEDMNAFINTDDVSEINEHKQYLTEAKQLEQAIKIFQNTKPDVNVNELRNLLMADPTFVSNDRGSFIGRYGMWIGNMYLNGTLKPTETNTLSQALNTYNINKSQIGKSINDIKSFDELCNIVSNYDDNFKAERTKSKAEQELEKVYEDDTWVVYIPHTWEADRKVGGDTNWCTAADNNGTYFNQYLNDYGGCYYVNINKKTGAKYQFHFESKQFMDKRDNPIYSLEEIGATEGLESFYFETLGKSPDDFSEMNFHDEPINDEYFIRIYEPDFDNYEAMEHIYEQYPGNVSAIDKISQLCRRTEDGVEQISELFDYISPQNNYLVVSITATPRAQDIEDDDAYWDDFSDGYEDCLGIMDYNGVVKSDWYSSLKEVPGNPNLIIAGDATTGMRIIDINGNIMTDWYDKILCNNRDTSKATALCFYKNDTIVEFTDMQLNKIKIETNETLNDSFSYGNYTIYTSEAISIVSSNDGSNKFKCDGMIQEGWCYTSNNGILTLVSDIDEKYQIYKIQGNTCNPVLQQPKRVIRTKRDFAYCMCGNYMPPTFEDLFNNQDVLYVLWNDYRVDPIVFVNTNGEVIGSYDFVDVYTKEYDTMIEKCHQKNDTVGITTINKCMDICRGIIQVRNQ